MHENEDKVDISEKFSIVSSVEGFVSSLVGTGLKGTGLCSGPVLPKIGNSDFHGSLLNLIAAKLVSGI
jgi:hypothetical protein